ncbi:MAG TPA: HAD family phosphatase [Thermoflexia bacterium]|nr:HAD family phosphatase [Thermoflexia bacterium]
MLTRAILFDFGGVLWRDVDRQARARWARELGMESMALEERIFESPALARAMLGEISSAEMWREIGVILGLDETQSRQLGENFFRGGQLNEKLLDFARQLRRHYQVGILSNAWDDARVDFTERLGLGEIFELLVISAEEGVAKPDPRIYQVAVERLGLRPPEVVFLDDRLENVAAARQFGMRAVHYQDNRQAVTEVQMYLGLARD